MDNQPHYPGNGDYRRRRASESARQPQNGRSSRASRNAYGSYEDARQRRGARASSADSRAGQQPRRQARSQQQDAYASRDRQQRSAQRRHAASDSARERVHSGRSERVDRQVRARGAAAPQVHQSARPDRSSLRRNTVSPFGYTEGQASRPFSYSDRNPINEGFSLGIDDMGRRQPAWQSRRRNVLPMAIAIILLLVIAAAAFFGLKSCGNAEAKGKANQNQEAANQSMVVADQSGPVTQKITLTFAGDCTLGTDENFSYDGSFTQKYNEVGDPSWFLANVREVFQKDDATIVNMEGTLTEATTRADKTFAFKAPAEYVNILTSSDVQAASLANNHSFDYGKQSYNDTIDTMEAAGIATFGYDRIAYLDVKGVKVALIGSYFPGDSDANEQETIDCIKQARDGGAQVVIVYAHWGIELDYVPDSDQINPAHHFVDAGADFVVGGHPHVVQGCETYNGTNIVYSLGNFCFGGSPHPRDPDCMMVQKTFTITNGKVVPDDDLTIIPCCSSSASGYNNYQPVILSGSRADEVMAKIDDSSRAIPSV